MSGLWNLFKVWSDEETLTNEDLNSSFQSVRDNAISDKIEGYSTLNNVSDNDRMDSEVNPYPNGSRSHASSVAGEIERIRYQLAQLTGDKWYSGISVPSIKPKINFAFPFTGRTKLEVASECARNGAISIDAFQHKSFVATDYNYHFISPGSGKFDRSGITNYGMAAQAHFGSLEHGLISLWFKQSDAGDVIFFNLGNGLECYVDTSGFVVVNLICQSSTSNTSKTIKTIQGSVDVTADSNWHNIIVSWKFNTGSSGDYLKSKLDGESLGTDISSASLVVGIADRCPFVFCQKLNKMYSDRISAYDSWNPMNLRPDDVTLPASAQFTRSTSGGGTITDSVSGGLLSMVADGSSSVLSYYQTNASIGSNSYSIFETKIRIENSTSSYFFIRVRDNTNDRDAEFRFTRRGVVLYDGGSSGSLVARASIDFQMYRHVEVVYDTSNGGVYNAKLYVDGILVISENLSSTAGSEASNRVTFGFVTGAGSNPIECYMEYFGLKAGIAGNEYLLMSDNSADMKESDIVLFDEDLDVSGVLSSNISSGEFDSSKLGGLFRNFYVSCFRQGSGLSGNLMGIMSDGKSSRALVGSVVATSASAAAEVSVAIELKSGGDILGNGQVTDTKGTIGRTSSPNSLFGVGCIPVNNYYTSIPIVSNVVLSPWYNVISSLSGSSCTPSAVASNITVSEV